MYRGYGVTVDHVIESQSKRYRDHFRYFTEKGKSPEWILDVEPDIALWEKSRVIGVVKKLADGSVEYVPIDPIHPIDRNELIKAMVARAVAEYHSARHWAIQAERLDNNNCEGIWQCLANSGRLGCNGQAHPRHPLPDSRRDRREGRPC